MLKIYRKVAWAWIIIFGGLIITPGGVECIVCGPVLSKILAVLSIGIGIAGLVAEQKQTAIRQ